MTVRTVAYTFTGNALSLFMDGTKSIIASDHPNFEEIKTALAARDYDKIPLLIDIPKAVSNFTRGRFAYVDDVLTFDGKPSSQWLTDKVRQLMAAKMPIDALLGFHEHLRYHPSFRVRQDLEAWLDRAKMPITADGYFLAWKYVREDFKDVYTGTIDNSPGQVVGMDRADVDDDPTHTCSAGLHVCSFDYLPQMGTADSGRRVVLVKVHVGHVVSIPTDYHHTKMRVCAYEVLEAVEDPTKDRFDDTPIYEEISTVPPTHRVRVRALNTETGEAVEGTYDVTVDLYENDCGQSTNEPNNEERDEDEILDEAKEAGITLFLQQYGALDLTEPAVAYSVETL